MIDDARRVLLGLLLASAVRPVQGGLAVTLYVGGEYSESTGILARQRILAAAAGANHYLALSAAGEVYAQGSSTRGQLGNGVSGDDQGVVAVKPGPELAGRPFVALSAGFDDSFALTADGQVFAWGLNHVGQLGLGHHDLTFFPRAVVTQGALVGRRVSAISAGFLHCLALSSDGHIFAWGANEMGQLGDGTTNQSSVPVAVDFGGAWAGKTIAAVAAGGAFSLALTSDGEVFGWGYNESGTVGDGTQTNRLAPVKVDLSALPAGAKVTAVAAGGNSALALASDGTVLTWGNNEHGELGDGTIEPQLRPRALDFGNILAGLPVIAIGAGARHSFIQTADGSLFAWGDNQFLELNVPGVNVHHFRPTAMATEGLLRGLIVTGFASGSTAYYTMFLTTEMAQTSVTLTASGARLTVTGEPATDYQLQRAASLIPPEWWQPLTTLTTDNAGMAHYSAEAATPSAFWRTVPARTESGSQLKRPRKQEPPAAEGSSN